MPETSAGGVHRPEQEPGTLFPLPKAFQVTCCVSNLIIFGSCNLIDTARQNFTPHAMMATAAALQLQCLMQKQHCNTLPNAVL